MNNTFIPLLFSKSTVPVKIKKVIYEGLVGEECKEDKRSLFHFYSLLVAVISPNNKKVYVATHNWEPIKADGSVEEPIKIEQGFNEHEIIELCYYYSLPARTFEVPEWDVFKPESKPDELNNILKNFYEWIDRTKK